MREWSKDSGGIARRIVIAIFAIAALTLGLAACGSDSDSPADDTSTAAAAVVDKEAGIYRDVQLTLVNGVPANPHGQEGDWFYVCFYTPDQCDDPSGVERWGDGYNVDRGKSVTATYNDELTGRVQYPIGYSYVEFTAFNPCCAAPWIKLEMFSDIKDGYDGHPALIADGKWSLPDIGKPQTVKLSGDNFTLERSEDTSDAIQLTLTPLGGASSPDA